MFDRKCFLKYEYRGYLKMQYEKIDDPLQNDPVTSWCALPKTDHKVRHYGSNFIFLP